MRRFRYWLGAALAGSALLSGRATTARAQVTLEDLDQKIRALERRLEIAEHAAIPHASDTPSFTAGEQGFSWTSADKTYTLKLRGYAQADARFFRGDDEQRLNDNLLIRRARLTIDGKLGQHFALKFAPEFGSGSTQLQDGYADFLIADAFNIRVGRHKIPSGVERKQAPSDTLFNETGLTTALTPNYDEGVLLYGSFVGGAVEYALGVFNGGPDGASIDSDTNDDKDLAARLWLTPFRTIDVEALQGLSFGVGGTFGKQSGTTNAPGLPSYRTSGQNTFFSYRTSSTNSSETALADGDRTRIVPQFYYNFRSIGLMGEYALVQQEVANGKGSETLKNDAWQLAASWVATGEKPSLKGVTPAKPFDPAKGQWGAFELKARVGELSIDDAAFEGGYAQATRSARTAHAAGLGVNWHLTRNAKIAVDYEQTSFAGGAADGDRPDEKVVIARAQVAF